MHTSKEDVFVLIIIAVLTGGCIAGIVTMDNPPEILSNMATMGFGAIVMKAKSVIHIKVKDDG